VLRLCVQGGEKRKEITIRSTRGAGGENFQIAWLPARIKVAQEKGREKFNNMKETRDLAIIKVGSPKGRGKKGVCSMQQGEERKVADISGTGHWENEGKGGRPPCGSKSNENSTTGKKSVGGRGEK